MPTLIHRKSFSKKSRRLNREAFNAERDRWLGLRREELKKPLKDRINVLEKEVGELNSMLEKTQKEYDDLITKAEEDYNNFLKLFITEYGRDFYKQLGEAWNVVLGNQRYGTKYKDVKSCIHKGMTCEKIPGNCPKWFKCQEMRDTIAKLVEEGKIKKIFMENPMIRHEQERQDALQHMENPDLVIDELKAAIPSESHFLPRPEKGHDSISIKLLNSISELEINIRQKSRVLEALKEIEAKGWKTEDNEGKEAITDKDLEDDYYGSGDYFQRGWGSFTKDWGVGGERRRRRRKKSRKKSRKSRKSRRKRRKSRRKRRKSRRSRR